MLVKLDENTIKVHTSLISFASSEHHIALSTKFTHTAQSAP